jgi:hypothetical protein
VVHFSNNTNTLTLNHGDQLKVVVDKCHYTVCIDHIVGDGVQLKLPLPFRLPAHNVYFYGKRVDDFKVIDQSQMFAVVFGALQGLIARVEQLEKTKI